MKSSEPNQPKTSLPSSNEPPPTKVEVESIPVKSQFESAVKLAEAKNNQPPQDADGSADKELDRILKDVNTDVKNHAPAATNQSKPHKATGVSALRRAVPLALALAAAAGLTAAAIYAFSAEQQNPPHTGAVESQARSV